MLCHSKKNISRQVTIASKVLDDLFPSCHRSGMSYVGCGRDARVIFTLLFYLLSKEPRYRRDGMFILRRQTNCIAYLEVHTDFPSSHSDEITASTADRCLELEPHWWVAKLLVIGATLPFKSKLCQCFCASAPVSRECSLSLIYILIISLRSLNLA